MTGEFCPSILPEDPAPDVVLNCELCGLYRHGQRVIWGEGNPNAPVFLLLDNPGARETKEGGEFLCETRETLQQGMYEAGLAIDQVYVTYVLKRRPIRAYDKPHARTACMSHLKYQLEQQKPKILFGFGNVVVQQLFPDQDADVKSLRGSWHDYEGIPFACSYHPLAVRRRPVLMKAFVEDLSLVEERVKSLGESV